MDKVQADEDKLEKLLTYGYAQCKYLLALNSEHYGVKTPESAQNWTLQEWEGAIARSHRPLRICLLRGKKPNTTVAAAADHVMPGGDPEAAVERFAAIANGSGGTRA